MYKFLSVVCKKGACARDSKFGVKGYQYYLCSQCFDEVDLEIYYLHYLFVLILLLLLLILVSQLRTGKKMY